MLPTSRLAATILCVLIVVGGVPVTAARPLPDLHKWDSYFALFAPDSSVPWKTATVRLDTFSAASVDLAAYAVDPADVIVAGTNARPRTISTSRLKPVVRWRFTPPSGYRFNSSEIAVPLANREGFFVIEARRNNVAEQVWINRTRIGMLTKESAGELLLYGADLGSGRALPHMRINFLAGQAFDTRYTDAHGVFRWRERTRPVFAIAEFGASKAFVSLLPQAPVPPAVAGIVVDSAVVHAGEDVRVVGFARMRAGAAFKASPGDATVSLRRGAAALAEQRVRLDRSGSFVVTLRVPAGTPEGDYPVLMQAASASAGTVLHVDGNAGGLALTIGTGCNQTCPANADVPLTIAAKRDGAPVAHAVIRVSIVRSPHLFSGEVRNKQWGLTPLPDQDVQTGDDGVAHVLIARPTDDLASTYGIRATSGGASAVSRVLVPTAKIALNLQIDRTRQTFGNGIGFEVAATTLADQQPAAHLPVRVRIVHGASAQEQTVTLDAAGRARGSFTRPELGSNLLLARATVDGSDALDAQELQVVPQTGSGESGTRSSDVSIAFDRASYRLGERVNLTAASRGASGDALLTYETPLGFDAVVAPVQNGTARAGFTTRNAPGTVAAGAAFVRDGVLAWNTAALALQGAGRAQTRSVHIDADTFSAGATATVKIDERNGADRTIIVRMTSGIPSGAARFDGTPDLLSIGEAASQDTAPPDAVWHAWVDATAAHASNVSFDRRTPAPPDDPVIADAQTRSVYWSVSRTGAAALEIPMPQTAGTYTVSFLEFGDDGHIAAGSQNITIR